jgi:hypothetical protein
LAVHRLDLGASAHEFAGHSLQAEALCGAYVPAWQSTQVATLVAPAALENVPAWQRTQADAAGPEYVPAAQVWQALTNPAPNVPALHATHALNPAAAKKPFPQAVQLLDPAGAARPNPHGSHVWAPRVLAGNEYVPGPHTLHVVFLPSMVDAVPSAHSSQSTSEVLEHALHPGNRLYLPAPHRMHGPPAGPHLPGMHEQFSRSHASGGENVPSGQVACKPP